MTITERLSDVVAEMLFHTWEYFGEVWKSLTTVLVLGVLVYLGWNFVLPLPTLSFLQAIVGTFVLRMLVGPPTVHYEPPLDAEERRLLAQEQIEDQGEPLLTVVND